MTTLHSARRLQSVRQFALDESPPVPPWRRARDFVARHRGKICFVIFVALGVAGVVRGNRPRSVMDVGDGWSLAALALAVTGLGLRSWATGLLYPNQVRATEGPFRFFRHPSCLGKLTAFPGLCILLADVHSAWVFLGPVVVYLCAMFHDEDYLSGRLEAVRIRNAARIGPNTPAPSHPGWATAWATRWATGWSVAQWWRNREYRPIRNAVLAACALEVWRAVI